MSGVIDFHPIGGAELEGHVSTLGMLRPPALLLACEVRASRGLDNQLLVAMAYQHCFHACLRLWSAR